MSENPEPSETLAAAAPPLSAPAPHPWEEALETWFTDLRGNLSGHGLATEVHNTLFTAKEDLKARLRGLIA